MDRDVASARAAVRAARPLVLLLRLLVPLLLLLLALPGAAPDARAQTASPAPPGSRSDPATQVPRAPSPADTSDWLPGSPAAADSIDTAGRTAKRDSISPPVPATNAPAPVVKVITQQNVTGLSAQSAAAGEPDRARPSMATGVYIGYPSYPGLFASAPADGSFAFRFGLTGFPTVGVLFTPGLEYRFGQEPGTLAGDGFYVFGNGLLGRSYLGNERDYAGAEAGFGYRWLIDDRRGPRWIAAVEAGGYWRHDPSRLGRPSLRFLWTLVE